MRLCHLSKLSDLSEMVHDGEIRFTHNFYNGFHEIVMRKNNL